VYTLTQQLAACVGVVGVDSGPSHIAVALGLPHVQIYNFDTAWRTGPLQSDWQQSVYAKPQPGVDEVMHIWQSCLQAHANAMEAKP
jgi:heptosyltransferase-1